MKVLYIRSNLSSLRRGVGSQCGGAVAAADDVARGVQAVLRASRAAAGLAAVCPRPIERQRSQVDAGDARARDGARSYQAFQHFVTDAPWRADRVWRRLRTVVPEASRPGDSGFTTFAKQGTQSVGVGRQYCGLQRQIINCQKAVTAAFWTGRAGLSARGPRCICPKSGSPRARVSARAFPTAVEFKQRWRLALTLLRQVRASGLAITGVLADAEFGDNRMFRAQLHRWRVPYAVGVSTHLRAFVGTPALTVPRATPGSHVSDSVLVSWLGRSWSCWLPSSRAGTASAGAIDPAGAGGPPTAPRSA